MGIGIRQNKYRVQYRGPQIPPTFPLALAQPRTSLVTGLSQPRRAMACHRLLRVTTSAMAISQACRLFLDKDCRKGTAWQWRRWCARSSSGYSESVRCSVLSSASSPDLKSNSQGGPSTAREWRWLASSSVPYVSFSYCPQSLFRLSWGSEQIRFPSTTYRRHRSHWANPNRGLRAIRYPGHRIRYPVQHLLPCPMEST